MADATLSIEGVSVRLGARDVVKDVSATVSRGHVLALVGPNGAGKSSLLRAIAGLVAHTGLVRVDDVVVPQEASLRAHHLAYVPQQSRLSSPLPVRDVVRLGRFRHQSSVFGTTAQDEALVERALERTRTVSLASRPFTAISLGEQRRVLVARALATESPVLLLDEPDAFLDVGQVVGIERLLRELADEGRAVVVVLHSLDVARRVADTCALLDDGKLRAMGAPTSVIDDAHMVPAYGVALVEGGALGYKLPVEASR